MAMTMTRFILTSFTEIALEVCFFVIVQVRNNGEGYQGLIHACFGKIGTSF